MLKRDSFVLHPLYVIDLSSFDKGVNRLTFAFIKIPGKGTGKRLTNLFRLNSADNVLEIGVSRQNGLTSRVTITFPNAVYR